MARLDRDVFALNVTKLAESLLKRLKQSRRRRVRRQNTDPVHLPSLILLRPGRERDRERQERPGQEQSSVHGPSRKPYGGGLAGPDAAKGGGQESAAVAHSMTRSARSSSDGGTVRPRAFAVLRLMRNSDFVGRSTGRLPEILRTQPAVRRFQEAGSYA